VQGPPLIGVFALAGRPINRTWGDEQ
jgi:hypothetical protein